MVHLASLTNEELCHKADIVKAALIDRGYSINDIIAILHIAYTTIICGYAEDIEMAGGKIADDAAAAITSLPEVFATAGTVQ